MTEESPLHLPKVDAVESTGPLDKQWWRARLLAQRAAVPPDVRATEAAALARSVIDTLAVPPTTAPEATRDAPRGESPSGREAAGTVPSVDWVAGYIPVGAEPGSLAMLDTLRAAGARVVVPVTGPPGPLDWAEYTGPDTLRRARYDLLEPDGPRLGTAAIGRARVILVPALAVDRRGVRLGRGAGYYDRSLPAAPPQARLVAVVRDEEFVGRLPEQPHDRRMGWALLPGAGLHALDGSR